MNLHIRADLRCLKVFIRGQKARISEISIEGIGVLMSHALHLYAMKLEMQANGFSLSCFFQPSRSGFWDSDEEKGDGGSGQLEEHCDPGLWQRCHLQEGTISEWPSFKMWNCINVVWQNKSHSDKNYSCPMVLISVSFMALFISILLSCPDSPLRLCL